jgi:uncharacterized membrane protein
MDERIAVPVGQAASGADTRSSWRRSRRFLLLGALGAVSGSLCAFLEAQAFDLLLRWLHFFAGIVWMGHNYSTLIQRPGYQPLAACDLTDEASPRLMGLLAREHGIFRWASVVAWTTGMLMLWQRGWLADAATLSGYHAVIGIGSWIGTAMMLNVWLVLWPHQKKVLGFVPAPVEERLRASRVTFLSARVNTMLSIPLLFFMASAQHGAFIYG